jgi:hypothetical protein
MSCTKLRGVESLRTTTLQKSSQFMAASPLKAYSVFFRREVANRSIERTSPASRAWSLMSNYKGFPTCQATAGLDGPRQRPIKEALVLFQRRGQFVALTKGKGCGLAELQAVIDAASDAADPDARRARGPHSLAEASRCCLHDMIRHTPRRSNPCLINDRAVTRWK